MNFIKRTVTLLNFFTHYKLATSLVLLGAIGLVVSCSLLHIDPTERREFAVCVTGEDTPEECKKSLHVSVLKSANPYRIVPDFASFYSAAFTLHVPKNEKLMSYNSKKKGEIYVSFHWETFAERFARYSYSEYSGSGFGYPIRHAVGSLIAIKETSPGEDGNELFVPADGDRSIFIDCIKPYRGNAGNLVTNVGCKVRTQLQPGVFIQYGIKRRFLHDWKSINEEILSQIHTVLKVH